MNEWRPRASATALWSRAAWESPATRAKRARGSAYGISTRRGSFDTSPSWRGGRILGSAARLPIYGPDAHENGRGTIARRNARRGWILGLSATAAALAAVVALSPMVIGGEYPDQTPQSFLNQAEGGGFDHNLAHQSASPAAKKRAAARLKLCGDAAWRASHEAFCPEEGATNAEVRTLRVAALDVSAQASEQPDGVWGPLFNIPTHRDPRRGDADQQGPLLLPAQVAGRGRDGGRRQRARVGPPDQHHHGRPSAGGDLGRARRSLPRRPRGAGQPLVRGPDPARRRARAGGGRQPGVPPQRRQRRRQRLQGRQVGHDLRPVDRDLDALPGHGARALVPDPHRAAGRPRADRGRLGRDRRQQRGRRRRAAPDAQQPGRGGVRPVGGPGLGRRPRS